MLTAVEQQQKMYNIFQGRLHSPLLTTPKANEQSKGLIVQLPTFKSREGENMLMWLLQVNLLIKAKKIDEEKRLQYIIMELKATALQWYLNLVQASEAKKLFKDWTQENALRFKNILGQIEEMYEANKVMYFIKGLKGTTKTEVSYCTSKTLEDAIRLALNYNSTMYGKAELEKIHAFNYRPLEPLRNKSSNTYMEQGPIPMELNRAEIKNKIKMEPIK
ncbi:41726_t:CDS:2, partial [Gigaspora margarita]